MCPDEAESVEQAATAVERHGAWDAGPLRDRYALTFPYHPVDGTGFWHETSDKQDP